MKYALYNTNIDRFLTSGGLTAITMSQGCTDPFDAKLYDSLHTATTQGRSLRMQYARKVAAGLITLHGDTVPVLTVKEITAEISNSFVLSSV